MSGNDRELKNILDDLFKAYGWTEKMDGVRVINNWEKVMGKIIAKHTLNLNVKKGTLYVEVDSSALCNELYMERSLIIDKINKALGKKVIKELIVK